MPGGRGAVAVGAGDAGMRLDRWLRARFPGLGQARIERLLRTGQIRVDGRRVRASERLLAGSTVRLPPQATEWTAPATRDRPMPPAAGQELQARVLYRDDQLIALDKPAGLAAQGGTGQARSLDRMAAGLVEAGAEVPRLAHRLDRATSGVLLLGCTRQATAQLAAAFRARHVRKVYWAALAGRLTPQAGWLTGRLERSPDGGPRRMRLLEPGQDASAARSVRTQYATLAVVGDRASWVALCPETGRTHQLRVQVAEAGAPVLGDQRYGSRRDSLGEEGGAGLHLHARSLEFAHPVSGAPLRIVAPLPPHMRKSWALLDWDPDPPDLDPFTAA